MLQPHRPKAAAAAKIGHGHSQRRTLLLPGLTSCCRAPGLDLTCSRNYKGTKQGLPVGETWQESAVRVLQEVVYELRWQVVCKGRYCTRALCREKVGCAADRQRSWAMVCRMKEPALEQRPATVRPAQPPAGARCCLDGWSCCWCCSTHHTRGSAIRSRQVRCTTC